MYVVIVVWNYNVTLTQISGLVLFLIFERMLLLN